MEDITDEIKDLQQSITSNFDGKNKDIKSDKRNNETKKDEFSQSYGEKIKVWQEAYILKFTILNILWFRILIKSTYHAFPILILAVVR